jgi:hypothetical protein
VIDGRTLHFTNAGLYDGLFTLYDAETHTLWNHITGDAEYGPMLGRTLGPPGNQLQMSVKQALEMDPKMEIAISGRTYFAGGRQFGTAKGFAPAGGRGGGGGGSQGPRGPNPDAKMNDRFAGTLGKEDLRRPRMELGLGVWTPNARRYYPMTRIREKGGVIVDRIDGKPLVVYIDPDTNNLAAIHVRAAGATMRGKDIVLDNGSVVRQGVLLDRGGKRMAMERPQQLFTRWYGWALTFPGGEVFGD